MAFVFWHSSKNGSESYEASGEIVDGVVDVINPDFGNSNDQQDLNAMLAIHLWFRKVVHVCVFALLCFLVTLLLSSYNMKRAFVALASIGFTILYAVSDELHQHFVPNRAGTLFDIGVDSLGAVIGWACALLALRIFFRILQKRQEKVK
jgi:VanZ family protein